VTRFVEQAIERAGLGAVLRARRAGDLDAVSSTMDDWKDADLLVLGAIADLLRAEEVGDEVAIHKTDGRGVLWIDIARSELDVLRAVAIARIAGPMRARVGVDWSRSGLELAQVALGFGASDLRGAITRKSGLPILEDESRKVKGQGSVSLSSIKKAEIAALVKHAGRLPVFVEELPAALEQGAHV
jgi:hypothetical protein